MTVINENQPTIICGAKTRSGAPCTNIAEADKKRCWLHGCGAGSGAPKGNKNALKHGFWTAEARSERALLHSMLKKLKNIDIEGFTG